MKEKDMDTKQLTIGGPKGKDEHLIHAGNLHAYHTLYVGHRHSWRIRLGNTDDSPAIAVRVSFRRLRDWLRGNKNMRHMFAEVGDGKTTFGITVTLVVDVGDSHESLI